jgi:hypothetical protein
MALVVVACTAISGSVDQPSGESVPVSSTAPAISPSFVPLTLSDVPSAPVDVLARFDPVGSFLYDGADRIEVELAIQTSQANAHAECMREQGWTFTAGQPSRAEIEAMIAEAAFGSPVSDSSIRSRSGYGIVTALLGPGGDLGDPQNDSVTAMLASLTADEQQLFFADNDRCAGEVATMVEVTPDAWELYSTGAQREAPDLRQALTDGKERWGTCMLDAGFSDNVQSEMARIESEARTLSEGNGTDPAVFSDLLAEEIALAEHDWDCYREHVLVPFLTLRLVEGQMFVEDYAEALLQVRADLKQAAKL